MRPRYGFAFVFFLAVSVFAQDAVPDYRNPKLPPEQRAADLLKRMTLEEKVDQLAGGRRRYAQMNGEAKQIFDKLGQLYKNESQVSPHDAAVMRNDAQK